MSLYLVVTDQPQQAFTDFVATQPNSKMWSDRIGVVQFDGSAQALVEKMTGPGAIPRSGLVAIQVAADYYGYSNKAFWDWLASAFNGPASA